MATGMVLTAAQTLFAALQCKELRDLCSAFRYESQLEELQQTVTTIEAVLLDAESKQQKLTHEGRNWVESLKDAVYDVDDLLDEFRTMALQRQQMSDAKISKKLSYEKIFHQNKKEAWMLRIGRNRPLRPGLSLLPKEGKKQSTQINKFHEEKQTPLLICCWVRCKAVCIHGRILPRSVIRHGAHCFQILWCLLAAASCFLVSAPICCPSAYEVKPS